MIKNETFSKVCFVASIPAYPPESMALNNVILCCSTLESKHNLARLKTDLKKRQDSLYKKIKIVSYGLMGFGMAHVRIDGLMQDICPLLTHWNYVFVAIEILSVGSTVRQKYHIHDFMCRRFFAQKMNPKVSSINANGPGVWMKLLQGYCHTSQYTQL